MEEKIEITPQDRAKIIEAFKRIDKATSTIDEAIEEISKANVDIHEWMEDLMDRLRISEEEVLE